MFKKLKTPFNVKPGTKTNSILSFILVLLALGSLPFSVIWDTRLIVLPVALWFLSAYEMLRGLKSDSPKLAKIARILIIIGALAIVVCAVMIFIGTINNLVGGANG